MGKLGNRIAVLVAAAAWLVSTGCAETVSFRFRESKEQLSRQGPVLVVDDALRDARPRSGVETGGRWRWVPGFPDGSSVESLPERDRRLEFSPATSIASALARLAVESRTFSEVVQQSDEMRRPGRTVHLSGDLTELSVRLVPRHYRVGFLAPVFWMLALPSDIIECRVEIELVLSDGLARTLWRGTLVDVRTHVAGLYFNSDWRRVLVDDVEDILRTEWRRLIDDIEDGALERR